MIPVPSGVRIWIASGHTDMRRGMHGLALQVQQSFQRDPHAGDLYIFRGKRSDLVKILWHDGIGMSLYAKRLDRGRYIWPSAVDGVVTISASQMAYLLDDRLAKSARDMAAVGGGLSAISSLRSNKGFGIRRGFARVMADGKPAIRRSCYAAPGASRS